MDFQEEDDHWDLGPFVGKQISRLLIDHALVLQFWTEPGELSIYIGGLFHLHEPGHVEVTIYAEPALCFAPALCLFQKEARSAKAYKDGSLELIFTDGTRLFVPPDTHYEPWDLRVDEQQIISSPGGGLVWI